MPWNPDPMDFFTFHFGEQIFVGIPGDHTGPPGVPCHLGPQLVPHLPLQGLLHHGGHYSRRFADLHLGSLLGHVLVNSTCVFAGRFLDFTRQFLHVDHSFRFPLSLSLHTCHFEYILIVFRFLFHLFRSPRCALLVFLGCCIGAVFILVF